MIASSSSSPPTRIDWATTMPPSEMTATSVVPPPMSTTMFPVGSWIGRPAPIAAAIGSSMMYARRAPAAIVASSTARCSTPVMPEELIAEIKGRDLVSGLPKTITITAEEIRRAIEEPVNAIIDAIKGTLDRTPPELAADIMDKGIVLTGGGALLRGLDKRLRHETGMPVHIAETPLQAVVLGSGKCLEEFEVLQRVLVSPSRR